MLFLPRWWSCDGPGPEPHLQPAGPVVHPRAAGPGYRRQAAFRQLGQQRALPRRAGAHPAQRGHRSQLAEPRTPSECFA